MTKRRVSQPWPPVICPGVDRVGPPAPVDPARVERRRGRRIVFRVLVLPVLALLLASVWWPPAAWLAGGLLAVPYAVRLRVNLNRW